MDGKKPAFPRNSNEPKWMQDGLSKREYFALKAMQASDLEKYAAHFGDKWAKQVAEDSVKMADALIAALA